MNIKTISLKDVLNSLSTALDFTYSGLSGHHKRVALMAVALGRKMSLPDDMIKRLYMASIIHDIGAITMREKESLASLDVEDPYTHSEAGSRLVDKTTLLKPVVRIIRHHHDPWTGGGPGGLRGSEIPLESRIINAVDRLDVLISHGRCVLSQSQGILRRLGELSGKVIDPDIFSELSGLAASESFWLDLDSRFLSGLIQSRVADFDIRVDSGMIMEISLLFSEVIDKKSRFTHKHSRLVAAASRKLALISGFSRPESEKMVVAGLLHDLGKISVPEEILEKPGKLSPEEFATVKRHAYYTYRIIEGISGMEEINRWASFHHERLDGTGYPFRMGSESIPEGARIVAVSDVFSALAENRPYRRGLPRQEILGIMGRMSGGALCPRIINNLAQNYDQFESLPGYDDPLAE